MLRRTRRTHAPRALRCRRSSFPCSACGPPLGRFFGAADDQPGGRPGCPDSGQSLERRFAGDPAAVGRTIGLDAVPVPIVGVLPLRFRSSRSGRPLHAGRPAGCRPAGSPAETIRACASSRVWRPGVPGVGPPRDGHDHARLEGGIRCPTAATARSSCPFRDSLFPTPSRSLDPARGRRRRAPDRVRQRRPPAARAGVRAPARVRDPGRDRRGPGRRAASS